MAAMMETDDAELALLGDDEQDEQDEQDEEEAQDYEVDQILDKRTHQGQLEYLVKWKGADANEDDTSWEPRRNLAGCDEALHEFETRQPRSREREASLERAAAREADHAVGQG